MTIVTQLSVPNPQSAGLPAYQLPTPGERAILAHPNVRNWWRADRGLTAEGWKCWKTGKPLAKERASVPARRKLGAYNDQDACVFTPTTQLWAPNVVPVGGPYSIVAAGRAGTNDSAFLAGGATQASTAKMYLRHQSVTGNGRVAFFHNYEDGSDATKRSLLAASMSHMYEAGPMLMIGSHDHLAAAVMGLRINGGHIVDMTGNPAEALTPNVCGELHVGGVNAFGAAIGGAVENGDLRHIIICDVGLHVATELRDLIETELNSQDDYWVA